MRFDHVAIASLAEVQAPHRVASEALEQHLLPTYERLRLQPGLLSALTGIAARRFWDAGTQPSDVAARAGKIALERAGVHRSALGAIISTSVSKDYIEPSVASTVHAKLELGMHCINFDVGNACLAFLNGMEIVATLIERRAIDYGLVVDGESSRQVVEGTLGRLLQPDIDQTAFFEHFATLTLGSGAVAMVLAHASLAPHGHRFRGGVLRAATQHNALCRGQVDHMRTDARGLLTAGVELARATFADAQTELGWTAETLDALMLHQVGATHTAKMLEAVGLDKRKATLIYPEFGNVGPAAIPMALAQAEARGQLQSGTRVALMGIGSGLNCAMMEVIW